MTIKEAGKDIVANGCHTSYLVGFNGNDETVLEAENINELEELWCSLCSEFKCEADSVDYVERELII